MDALTTPPLSILVVEPDPDIKTLLGAVLTDEGYHVTLVTSFEDAWQQLTTSAFALILADLFVGHSKHAFTPAHLVRRHAWPTLVVLLMTNPLSPEEAHAAGFAGVIPLPFDVSDFLTTVAAFLQQPFTPQQARQAEVVRRFLEARAAEDWETVGALCTPEVRSHPPRNSRVTPARQLYGRAALGAYERATSAHYRQVVYTDLRLYARPSGLAARYTSHWTTPEGQRYRVATTAVFQFAGDQIRQIGIHTPLSLSVLEDAQSAAG